MLRSVTRANVVFKNALSQPCFKRSLITGPKKTGSNPVSKTNSSEGKSSGSPFDSSFSFQLFLIVGAMGAGYTLGKTTILTSPPGTLFPEGSITTAEVLKEFEKEDKERESKQYDMFKRCALRILENKGVEVDMKYGKNEALFDEKYCSKDIAKIMNIPDGMSDVFFGKDPKEWEGKTFVWYPETTEDVSLIMKNCQEFKIPVFTKASRANNDGLTFIIDFENFKHNSFENKVELTFNMDKDTLNERLQSNNYLNNRLNSTDLFFMGCGVKLPNSNNKLINNKWDINSIDEIECVLPDGTVLNAVNDVNDDTFKLFKLFTGFQDELCLVTRAFVNKKRLDASVEKENLVVIGANDLGQLNNILQELKTDNKVSIVDNNGCQEISTTYGDYSTFAVTKVTDKGLYNLNKKFTQGEEKSSQYKINTTPVADILNNNLSGYLSELPNDSNRAVIVKEDVKSNDAKTYYVSVPSCELKENDTDMSYLRRIKLATDPARSLNPGVGVTVHA